jgi:hypothetical protein
MKGAYLLLLGIAVTMADHPGIQCCAGNDGDSDGSYCSDLQMLADYEDELRLFAGHYGSDVEGSRFSLYLNKEGEEGIEESVAGWYLRPSEDNNTDELQATAWFKCQEKCVTYDFPADIPLPRACFGAGTLLPRLVATNAIDEELTSNTYAPDKDAEHHMKVAAAVHESTCAPMWIVAGPDDDSSPSSAGRLRSHPHLLSPLSVLGGLRGNKSSKLSKKGHHDSDDWGILFFVNGTADVPDDKYFGVPSYCDERVRKQQ